MCEEEITKKDGVRPYESGNTPQSIRGTSQNESAGNKSFDEVGSPVKNDVRQVIKPFETVAPPGELKTGEQPSETENSGLSGRMGSQPGLAIFGNPESDKHESTLSGEKIDVPDQNRIEKIAEVVSTTGEKELISVPEKDFKTENPSETIRRSGLAWSAAMILFGSVAVMTLFGWLADLRFTTQPWGLVIGIVLGAVIGFIQFFRTTAQIFNDPGSEIKK